MFASRADFSGRFSLEQGSRTGRISITAKLQPGWHIYSTTQARGGPLPTVIDVPSSADYEVTGAFVADRDAHVHEDPAFPGISVEEFEREVTWSAPLRLADNVPPDKLVIDVTVNGQVCEAGGSCELISDVRVSVAFAGYDAPQSSNAAGFRDAEGHISLTGHIEPKVAAPGGTIHLVLSARLAPTWHVYAWAETDPQKISKPTLIVLRKTSGWRYGKPKPSSAPKSEESGLKEEPVLHYHEDEVTWTVPMQVPKDAVPGVYDLAGAIGFQTCSPSLCDMQTGVDFRAQVSVAPQPVQGTIPLQMTTTSYERVAEAAATAAEMAKSKAADTADSTDATTWATSRSRRFWPWPSSPA